MLCLLKSIVEKLQHFGKKSISLKVLRLARSEEVGMQVDIFDSSPDHLITSSTYVVSIYEQVNIVRGRYC